MASAYSACSRYSCESVGPTVEIDDCARSTVARLPSAPHSLDVSFPKSVCVSMLQRESGTSPVLVSVLIRSSPTPIVERAEAICVCVTLRSNLSVTSVPPVNERPSRSGAPVLCQCTPIVMRPAAITTYEIAETIRNQPTMFQFRRRKNTLRPGFHGGDIARARTVRGRRGNDVRIDDDVHKEARDVHGRRK